MHNTWKRYMETKNWKNVMQRTVELETKYRVRTRKQYELKLAKYAKGCTWIQKLIHVCVSDFDIDPRDPQSRLTNCDKEKAELLEKFFSGVFTVAPSGDMLKPDMFDLKWQS